MKTIKALLIPVEGPLEYFDLPLDVGSGLALLQEEVGGDGELVAIRRGTQIASAYCNEDGIALTLPINIRANLIFARSDRPLGCYLLGPVVLTGGPDRDGNNRDWTPEMSDVFFFSGFTSLNPKAET